MFELPKRPGLPKQGRQLKLRHQPRAPAAGHGHGDGERISAPAWGGFLAGSAILFEYVAVFAGLPIAIMLLGRVGKEGGLREVIWAASIRLGLPEWFADPQRTFYGELRRCFNFLS